MALIIKSFMFVPDTYMKIKGVEICREKKKFVIRMDASKNGVKVPIEAHEYVIDRQSIIDGCRTEALELINVDSLEKAIREKIKNENAELKKKKLPRIPAAQIEKRIAGAVEAETSKLMKEIGETKFNAIFESHINREPVIKIAYEYLKTYIPEYKDAKDA